MKRKPYKILLSGVLLGLTLLAGGCFQAKNVDEYGYVLSIGVDEGKVLPYQITFMLQQLTGSSDAQAPKGFLLLGTECSSLFEAVDVLSSTVPYQLNLSRLNTIVFGSGLAQSGQMEAFLNMSVSDLEIRHSVHLLVARGYAADFLGGMENETDPAVAKIQLSVEKYALETGYSPVTTLSLFYEAIHSKCFDTVIPLCGYDKAVINEEQTRKALEEGGRVSDEIGTDQQPDEQASTPEQLFLLTTDSVGARRYGYLPDQMVRHGGLKSSVMGCALFRNEKMVGYLDGQHTQVLLMGRGDFQEGRLQLLDPNGEYLNVALMTKQGTRVELTQSEAGGYRATIRVYLEGEVGMPETVRQVTTEELQQHISAYIQKEMEQVFATCRTLGVDAFGLGRYAVRDCHTAAQWEALDWQSRYAKTETVFEVYVKLKHTFTQSGGNGR